MNAVIDAVIIVTNIIYPIVLIEYVSHCIRIIEARREVITPPRMVLPIRFRESYVF